jgi:biopolymer transport protein ExbD
MGGFFLWNKVLGSSYSKLIVMSEINNPPGYKRHQPTTGTKNSTRVDLTPMVDLGFILITFFVFTAALSRPMAMNLMVPNDKDTHTQDFLCESCVLTVLLDRDNTIWYYEGKGNYAANKATNYSGGGIRQLIQQKKRSVLQKRGSDQFVLIIKPAAQSSFKNLVDIVDECSIGMVKRYYIDEVTVTDKNWLEGNR